jgi:hypothetical protein
VKHLALFVMLLCALAPARAQTGDLTVSAASGTIQTGMACPSPLDGVQYATVQAALDCAPDGARIRIMRGIYPEALTVMHSVTLMSDAGIGAVELVGNAEQPVITTSEGVTLTLENLVLSNGAGARGGGITMPSGTLTLIGVLVRDSAATEAGGGVYLGVGRADIRESVFSRNSVTAFTSAGDAVVEAFGGGVYIDEGQLTIVDTLFVENSVVASGCGGARPQAAGSGIYSRTAQVTLQRVEQRAGRALVSDCGGSTQTISIDASVDVAVPAALLQIANDRAVRVAAIPSPEVTAEPDTRVAREPVRVADDPTLAVAWMDVMLNAVRSERLSPPVASRLYAYTSVALYESLVPGRPETQSLSASLNGGLTVPAPDRGMRYDWQTVANASMLRVSQGLMPQAARETRAMFSALNERINLRLGDSVPVNVFRRSVAYGEAVADAVLAWAAADNYDEIHDLHYTVPAGDPGYWLPLEGQSALEPFWGILRPFVLQMSNDCEVEPPFAASMDPASLFFAETREVYDAVQNITPEHREIALFWADNPGETATPPGHWISIIGLIVRQENLSLSDAADLYATTGVAMADAFIAAWYTKYRLNWVRPVTVIRDHLDPAFQTVVGTPPFPEYPSGHSVASGAAAAVLSGMIGDVPFDDTTHLQRGLAPRHFDTFEAAAQEAAISRLYGGIHYRTSIDLGVQMGRCIGERVITHLP